MFQIVWSFSFATAIVTGLGFQEATHGDTMGMWHDQSSTWQCSLRERHGCMTQVCRTWPLVVCPRRSYIDSKDPRVGRLSGLELKLLLNRESRDWEATLALPAHLVVPHGLKRQSTCPFLQYMSGCCTHLVQFTMFHICHCGYEAIVLQARLTPCQVGPPRSRAPSTNIWAPVL